MKKPSPAKLAARERKLEAKRARAIEYIRVDRVLTIGIAALSFGLGVFLTLITEAFFRVVN